MIPRPAILKKWAIDTFQGVRDPMLVSPQIPESEFLNCRSRSAGLDMLWIFPETELRPLGTENSLTEFVTVFPKVSNRQVELMFSDTILFTFSSEGLLKNVSMERPLPSLHLRIQDLGETETARAICRLAWGSDFGEGIIGIDLGQVFHDQGRSVIWAGQITNLNYEIVSGVTVCVEGSGVICGISVQLDGKSFLNGVQAASNNRAELVVPSSTMPQFISIEQQEPTVLEVSGEVRPQRYVRAWDLDTFVVAFAECAAFSFDESGILVKTMLNLAPCCEAEDEEFPIGLERGNPQSLVCYSKNPPVGSIISLPVERVFRDDELKLFWFGEIESGSIVQLSEKLHISLNSEGRIQGLIWDETD